MPENNAARPRFHTWLPEPMTAEVRKALVGLQQADDVQHIAVMPDVHLARDICVGTVLATDRLIYPQAVGSDIGCGMAVAAFHAGADVLSRRRSATAVLKGLRECVPIMRHRGLKLAPAIPNELESAPLSANSLRAKARRSGRIELGTLGRGNHFLELQADEEDRLWLMVHSGSRALGQLIYDHHRPCAKRGSGSLLHFDSAEPGGKAYLTDVDWATRFASVNRLCMVDAVARLMQQLFNVELDRNTVFDGSHNHVSREPHGDRQFWVHRKGANRAAADEPGIIPGSMATTSFHVSGRGCPDALNSSSHGAGRAMSRGEARQRISRRRLIQQLEGVWYEPRLVSRLCEEAPAAYKDIDAVMRAQKELVRIERRLRPLLVYKGA